MKFSWMKVMTIFSLLLFVAAIIQIFVSWSSLPDQVPTHYNALGEADRWGHKAFIFFAPLFGLAMWGLLHAINRPTWINMPGFDANEASPKQLENAQLMLKVIANELLIVMSLLSFKDVYVAKGGMLSLGIWEMIAVLVILIGTALFFTFRNSHLKHAEEDVR